MGEVVAKDHMCLDLSERLVPAHVLEEDTGGNQTKM